MSAVSLAPRRSCQRYHSHRGNDIRGAIDTLEILCLANILANIFETGLPVSQGLTRWGRLMKKTVDQKSCDSVP
jgi:hypothetical protein